MVLLDDQSITPFDLFRYRVVVVTYKYLVAERNRMEKFEVHLAEYERGDRDDLPERPRVAIFSDIFEIRGVRSFGKFLILDDAHLLVKYGEMTAALRPRFEACIPVTRARVTGGWKGTYALLSMLKGHPISSLDRMRALVSDAQLGKGDARSRVESGDQKLNDLLRFIQGVRLRRLDSDVTGRQG